MKKGFLFAFIFLAVQYFSFGQDGDLMMKSSDKGLYLDHKVAAKENFYSVGRLYNIPPKEIAVYNKLDMNKGLNLGQTIRIPLTAGNFSQSGNKGTPIYYKVGEKEGLLKISNTANKVSLENLRRWNSLSNDNVNFGNKLIVGFLVVNEMPAVTVAEKKEPAVVEPAKTEKTVSQPVVVIKDPKKEDPVIKNEPKKEDPVIKNEVKEETVNKKEPVIDKQKTENKTLTPEQGYFKSFFEQQVKAAPLTKEETVTSGIFKTSSGWQDAKYYLLMDGVQSGTIVKVINPDNNKAVYAKVLGQMSGIRQNEGLNIRISNAAATSLGIAETDKFIVKVNY